MPTNAGSEARRMDTGFAGITEGSFQFVAHRACTSLLEGHEEYQVRRIGILNLVTFGVRAEKA